MSSAARHPLLTPSQYLAIERKSDIKHQFFRGEMFAMAGASREHNLISLNLASILRNQLLDRPCEAYVADMRVLVEATGLYTYPDVVVACGEPRFEDREVDTLLNPTLIVEVLSPSTESYDRGRKFAQYRTLPSLREYVMVAQDSLMVEVFSRQGDQWLLSAHTDPESLVPLESLGCEVRLKEIYSKVEFPPPAPPPVTETR